MTPRRTVPSAAILVLLAAVALAGCGGTDEDAAAGFEQLGLSPDDGRLAPLDCPATLEGDPDAVCALVTMPTDHGQPDGDELQIAIAALPAFGDDAGAPMVYLEGGPGFGAMASADDWIDGNLAELRDGRVVVLVDQRGTGYGEPFLGCPEVEEQLDEFADEVDAIEACVDRLGDDGVDLDDYSSAANAADIAELRAVLGVEEWDVMGSSYGTRLALTLARDDPSGIRALALDGLFPPEADGAGPVGARETGGFALDAFVERCESDPDCVDTVGDPRGAVVDAIDCAESDDEQLGVDGTLVVNTMIDLLPDPTLPELIATTADCGSGALDELAASSEETAFARTSGRARRRRGPWETAWRWRSRSTAPRSRPSRPPAPAGRSTGPTRWWRSSTGSVSPTRRATWSTCPTHRRSRPIRSPRRSRPSCSTAPSTQSPRRAGPGAPPTRSPRCRSCSFPGSATTR